MEDQNEDAMSERIARIMAEAEAQQSKELGRDEPERANPARALGAWIIVAAMMWCGAAAMAMVLWFL